MCFIVYCLRGEETYSSFAKCSKENGDILPRGCMRRERDMEVFEHWNFIVLSY